MTPSKISLAIISVSLIVGCTSIPPVSSTEVQELSFEAERTMTIQSLLDAGFEVLHPQEKSFFMRRDNYLYRCRLKQYAEDTNVCFHIQ